MSPGGGYSACPYNGRSIPGRYVCSAERDSEGSDAGNKLVKEIDKAASDHTKAFKAKDRKKMMKTANEVRAAYAKLKKSRQRAITLADKYYKPDGKNAKGEPKYDVFVKGEGVTAKDGSVRIGESAFTTPGWLASTKMHEFVHTDQAKNGTWQNDTKGVNMNELEAYDKEIAKAATSGLSKKQIDDLKALQWSFCRKQEEGGQERVFCEGNHAQGGGCHGPLLR